MKNRSVAKVIILSFITVGIYQLFWTYETKEELRQKGYDVMPFKWLLLPVLGLVAIALAQFVTHFLLNSLAAGINGPGAGQTIINVLSLIVGVVVLVSIIPIYLIWYYKYCKAAETATAGQLGFGFSYGLLIVLNFFSLGWIWPGVVQNSFNKVSSVTT